MNKKKSILESNVLYTIVAIIAGFLVGAIFLADRRNQSCSSIWQAV